MILFINSREFPHHLSSLYVQSHVPPAAVESDARIATSTLVPMVQYMPMITYIHPAVSREKQSKKEEVPSETKVISRREAAVTIQRQFRKYSHRKKFSDREINPIIKYHRPATYLTGLIIKEVVIVCSTVI